MKSIEVTNDGKGKHQSFEARIVFPMSIRASLGWIGEFEIVGLGETEAEAKDNLNRMLVELRTKIGM